ncbi:MAG: InlB B-repeat-containing protein, partial [Candidatus Izemoplasmatales bacterium]
FENVISVSAVDSLSSVAAYSNYNEAVDIAAPGSDIITTSMDGGYVSGSGTSFAAPHITGILSLYLSLYPSASVDEVRSKLYLTATDLGSSGLDDYYGNGLVNADKLLTSTYYQLSFDSSPGSEVEPIYILSGMMISSLPAPTLTNQVFLGWYMDEQRSIPFEPGMVVSSDITLYALYSDSFHTVHFVTSGSTVSDLIVAHFDTFTLPTTSKIGYRFIGWYLDADYQTIYLSSPVLTDITLYAKFEEIIYYTVTYIIDNQIVRVDSVEENSDYTLYEPSKTGYTFLGWYLNDTFSTSFTGQTITSNITLFADFEINTYQITLVANSETTILDVLYLDYPNLFEPSAPDLVFAGWYLDSNYQERYILSETTSSFTLYAKFVSYVYEVTLYVNTEFYDRIYFETDETISIPQISELGKTFDGWYSNAEMTSLFSATSIDSDISLYASLTDTTYIITFYTGDGFILSTLNLSYGDRIIYPPSTTKTATSSIQYIFSSWSESVSEATEDLSIYPIFTPSFIESSLTVNPAVTTIYTGSDYIDGGVSVLDPQLSISIINSVNTEVAGKYSVTYQIYLEDTLVYQYIRYIKVLESPIDVVITLNPGIDTIYVGFPYVEAGAKTNEGTIEIIGEVDNLIPGSYLIYYQVEIGNVYYLKTRIVTVLSTDQLQVTILQVIKKEDETL